MSTTSSPSAAPTKNELTTEVEIPVAQDPQIFQPKSIRIGMVNWWHVFATLYLPRLFTLILVVLVAIVANSLSIAGVTMDDAVGYYHQTQTGVIALGWQGVLLGVAAFLYYVRRGTSIYLMDFSVFTAPDSWRVTHEQLLKIMNNQNAYNEESLGFMEKILARSGTGQATAWPPNLTAALVEGGPSKMTVEQARTEFEQVVYPAVEDALKKTKLKAKQVDFLIINCSLFSPTPSLCAMIALKFGMRPDIRSFNLSGMGCSASVISIDLAKHLLTASPNSTALVISTENLSRCLYKGQKRSMLLQNTLFRCGAAVMVLSNKLVDAPRARYKLLHTVRTQRISQEAYECVFECQDDEDQQGIRLSKDIVKVAGKALTANLTTLGPLILPIRELAKTVGNVAAARFLPKLRALLLKNGYTALAERVPEKVQSYVPDFTRCVDHFCVHAGGRAVIDGIEQNLRLQPHHMEASRTTLREFGNTSSSSIWYELQAVEKAGKVKRGDRVLQIAFGSGFKCNSAVWLALKEQ